MSVVGGEVSTNVTPNSGCGDLGDGEVGGGVDGRRRSARVEFSRWFEWNVLGARIVERRSRCGARRLVRTVSLDMSFLFTNPTSAREARILARRGGTVGKGDRRNIGRTDWARSQNTKF